MKGFWRFMVCCVCLLSWILGCWSALNDEGVALLKLKAKIENDPKGALSNWIQEVGVENPCSWSGVGCSNGYVVLLNLADLCLKGTLSSDIGRLIHVKSINLLNNSFFGTVPEEITNLKELEVLDLRCNNFTGQLPHHFSTAFLFVDNSDVLGSSCPEPEKTLSGAGQGACNGLVISWKSKEMRNLAGRKLLQQAPFRRLPPLQLQFPPQAPRNLPPLPPDLQTRSIATPTPSPAPAPAPVKSPTPSLRPFAEPPPSSSSRNRTSTLSTPLARKNSRTINKLILSVIISGSVLLLLSVMAFVCYKTGKVSTVKPWATGLSGQLQRAFVTGVPKLKRSELEAACEDFSNVIGSLSVCTLYKGTLSRGVEIAVASLDVASSRDWSSSMESQFRKKIDTLSKVNHKNFLSLIGYCEEDTPFTRMMVFEYAPNGTLFEHIHIKEAEHLDWETRLRVAMGIVYCLDHMHHKMTPGLAHRNLTSSSIYLTEDYAAKVSDFTYWGKDAVTNEHQSTPQSNVYSFGVILCEIITGKLPYSSGSDSPDDWASDYLKGMCGALREMVDPTLRTYGEEQLGQLEKVIKSCVDQDPMQRPSMGDVSARLREITGIGPEGAIPKVSPLWWAEIEIQSSG